MDKLQRELFYGDFSGTERGRITSSGTSTPKQADQRQVNCLIGDASPEMMLAFDKHNAIFRALVRDARHNLCVWCVEQFAYEYRDHMSLGSVIRCMEIALDNGVDADQLKIALDKRFGLNPF